MNYYQKIWWRALIYAILTAMTITTIVVVVMTLA